MGWRKSNFERHDWLSEAIVHLSLYSAMFSTKKCAVSSFLFFFCILRTSVSLISLGENTSYPEKNLASSLVRSHPYTSPFSDTVMQPILQLTTCGWHDKQANLISSQRMKTSVSNDLIAVVRRFHRRSRCYAGHELWNSSYKGPYLALRPPCANFGICLTKDTYLGLLCCYYLSTHMLPSCFLFWIIAINAES